MAELKASNMLILLMTLYKGTKHWVTIRHANLPLQSGQA